MNKGGTSGEAVNMARRFSAHFWAERRPGGHVFGKSHLRMWQNLVAHEDRSWRAALSHSSTVTRTRNDQELAAAMVCMQRAFFTHPLLKAPVLFYYRTTPGRRQRQR
jgi:hypothetical protein